MCVKAGQCGKRVTHYATTQCKTNVPTVKIPKETDRRLVTIEKLINIQGTQSVPDLRLISKAFQHILMNSRCSQFRHYTLGSLDFHGGPCPLWYKLENL